MYKGGPERRPAGRVAERAARLAPSGGYAGQQLHDGEPVAPGKIDAEESRKRRREIEDRHRPFEPSWCDARPGRDEEPPDPVPPGPGVAVGALDPPDPWRRRPDDRAGAAVQFRTPRRRRVVPIDQKVRKVVQPVSGIELRSPQRPRDERAAGVLAHDLQQLPGELSAERVRLRAGCQDTPGLAPDAIQADPARGEAVAHREATAPLGIDPDRGEWVGLAFLPEMRPERGANGGGKRVPRLHRCGAREP